MMDAIDTAVLDALREDLPEDIMAEVVGHFIADGDAMLAAMQDAGGNESAWQRAAHRLAGGAAAVGAVKVAARARRLMSSPLPADPAQELVALAAEVAEASAALRALTGPRP